MAASYPAGFDTMSDPSANLSGPPLHSTMHNQINDVLEAIEAELGLTPSGADATVAATLAALPSRYEAIHSGGCVLTDAAQSIPSGAGTDVTWGSEVSDPDGWTAGGIATLTVPAGKAGRYIMTYSGSWASAPGGNGSHSIQINGVGRYEMLYNSGSLLAGTLTVLRTLAVGDTIKVVAFHTAGAAINLISRFEIGLA